jgi:transposase
MRVRALVLAGILGISSGVFAENPKQKAQPDQAAKNKDRQEALKDWNRDYRAYLKQHGKEERDWDKATRKEQKEYEKQLRKEHKEGYPYGEGARPPGR